MRPLAEDELALRFTEGDLDGWFTKEIRVRQGSLGLLLLDGRFDRVLPPGRNTLNSFWQGLLHRGAKNEVVLVRSGEVTLKFTLPNLLTADTWALDLEWNVVVQLWPGSEYLFYLKLMGERERLTLLDLRPVMYPPLRDVVSTWFGQRRLEDLMASPELYDLAMEAELAMSRALLPTGLRVLHIAPSVQKDTYWVWHSPRVKAILERPKATPIDLSGLTKKERDALFREAKGMWADHPEIKDSVEWVRGLREGLSKGYQEKD